ncbi:hypothetical protein DDZ14_13705 [Maritimibacter sp. 55A14]|uniref:hypothetical protein n=1 Tax=Maritimibacter sp. 55A14 TaxID=2174844 RepID=UPI000D605CBF|nr:hypothetical protein [Maritimibacter sp. 55A14]PWE31238.1 hypothetical protein DDZ14_13705 [Maritimibacter sp. 55A14]
MLTGKTNIVMGIVSLALFILYGFVLIFLRDFTPGREHWIVDYAVGKHFETRLAHVHGNLFALINIAVGLVLLRLPASRGAAWMSGLALLGLLMPSGILAKMLLGAPPILVMFWGISMVAAMTWAAADVWKTEIFQ